MSALMLKMLHISATNNKTEHSQGGVGVPARYPRREGTTIQIMEFTTSPFATENSVNPH